MAAILPGQPLCDICGDWGAKEGLIVCSNQSRGCLFARHQWCFKNRNAAALHKTFYCNHCKSANSDSPDSHFSREKRPIGEKIQAKSSAIQNVKSGLDMVKKGLNSSADLMPRVLSMMASPNEAAEAKSGHPFTFTSKAQPSKASGGLPQVGSKRAATTALDTSCPPAKARSEPAGREGPVDLFKSTMQGLQKEQQRRKLSRVEAQVPPPGAHASESRSEQRLKRRRGTKPTELQIDAIRASQRQVIAASIQAETLWSGTLQLDLETSQGPPPVGVVAHSLADNPHAMDAILRLPSCMLTGTVLETSEVLEMSSVEASENACLVFRGSDEDNRQVLQTTMQQHLDSENVLVQILLGNNKPLWLALIPSLPDALFGVFVKFDEQWLHSNTEPSKGLLQKKQESGSHKVEWPDGLESNRRSTDCERGRGSDYGHLRIRNKMGAEVVQPATSNSNGKPAVSQKAARTTEIPNPGPLAFLSVAIVGFQRDHEEILKLRRDLVTAGAQTFTAPWPGCVRVLVFPEQLFNKELTLENHAPKELQPIKDFQAAPQTRIFIRIDYPRLCCQLGRLPTLEEEARHNVKELWPEGCVITADAATLHAAVGRPSSSGSGSLLEEVLDELKQAASSSRRAGTVWMLTATKRHLQELESTGSAAHKVFLKWWQTKRFQVMDSGMATNDLILNALKLAQFYRFFCRYTVVLARPDDEELKATADARKTVFCADLGDVVGFLQNIRTSV